MIIWDKNGNRKEIYNDYIDLGLPSGTLWAYRDFYRINKRIKFIDYINSFYFQNLIPTKDQFKELAKFCNVKIYRDFYLFISKINGNKLILFDGFYQTLTYDMYDKISIYDEVLGDSSYNRRCGCWCLRLVKRKE